MMLIITKNYVILVNHMRRVDTITSGHGWWKH